MSCGGGLLRELGLTLALEFLLHRNVGQTLALDLGERNHFGFGCSLEVLELLAGLAGGLLLAFELGALCAHLFHHGVEVVEFDRGDATGDRCLPIGGDASIGLVEVDQEWDRGAGVDEASLGVQLQAAAHGVGLGLGGCQVLFGGRDLEFEGVEL